MENLDGMRENKMAGNLFSVHQREVLEFDRDESPIYVLATLEEQRARRERERDRRMKKPVLSCYINKFFFPLLPPFNRVPLLFRL